MQVVVFNVNDFFKDWPAFGGFKDIGLNVLLCNTVRLGIEY